MYRRVIVVGLPRPIVVALEPPLCRFTLMRKLEFCNLRKRELSLCLAGQKSALNKPEQAEARNGGGRRAAEMKLPARRRHVVHDGEYRGDKHQLPQFDAAIE